MGFRLSTRMFLDQRFRWFDVGLAIFLHFNILGFQQSRDMDPISILENLKGVPLSHPTNIAQLFTPNATSPTNITFDYTVKGLAKLLHFSNFIKTQSENVIDNLRDEVNKYPYNKKPTLQVMYQYLDRNAI